MSDKCPKCGAPCIRTVNIRGGDYGWSTSDEERAAYKYALSAHGQPVVDKAMVKKAVDATAPPDRTCLDHEEYAEAILAAALKGADHE